MLTLQQQILVTDHIEYIRKLAHIYGSRYFESDPEEVEELFSLFSEKVVRAVKKFEARGGATFAGFIDAVCRNAALDFFDYRTCQKRRATLVTISLERFFHGGSEDCVAPHFENTIIDRMVFVEMMEEFFLKKDITRSKYAYLFALRLQGRPQTECARMIGEKFGCTCSQPMVAKMLKEMQVWMEQQMQESEQ